MVKKIIIQLWSESHWQPIFSEKVEPKISFYDFADEFRNEISDFATVVGTNYSPMLESGIVRVRI
jgi:hypothetical protein